MSVSVCIFFSVYIILSDCGNGNKTSLGSFSGKRSWSGSPGLSATLLPISGEVSTGKNICHGRDELGGHQESWQPLHFSIKH